MEKEEKIESKFKIQSINDLLQFDEETFQRMIPDLVAWHKITRKTMKDAKSFGFPDGAIVPNGFVWVDDGKQGECTGVSIGIK